MSGMMMHGLGDRTPERSCGCMAKPPDVLRKRIARALWEHRYPGVEQTGPLADLALTDADAVVAALGLVEGGTRMRYICDPEDEFYTCEAFYVGDGCDHLVTQRYWRTPWERIEEDE